MAPRGGRSIRRDFGSLIPESILVDTQLSGGEIVFAPPGAL